MTTSSPDQTSDLNSRKALGRGYLNINRVKEALDIFASILNDFPNDIETLLTMGDLYLGSGDDSTALQLYARALKVDSTRTETVQRIQLAAQDHSANYVPPAEEIPSDPEAISRLLQRLSGRNSPVTEEDIHRAALLLNEILNSPNPAQKVSTYLDEIDSLLPALIELNIRQAYSDGRPDLADALTNLQVNIDLQVQIGKQNQDQENSAISQVTRLKSLAARMKWKTLFLVPDVKEIPTRIATIADWLQENGCNVTISEGYQPGVDIQPDIVILSCPHSSQSMLEIMAFFTANHIPMILDAENNFEEMPVDFPDYGQMGLGSQPSARRYHSSLLLANHVATSSNFLAEMYRSAGFSVSYLPDGWSRSNKLWQRPQSHRSTINIGWMATAGNREDLSQIRRVINRVIREFPQTQLVISRDPDAYQLFEGLPESRKLFLPSAESQDYPYLLSQIDILLVPLRNIPYYHSLSDRILVEAGIKRIPWLATPIPSFHDWKAGGLLANSLEEWHTYLRELVMDDTLRTSLGEAGRQHSAHREMSGVGLLWLELFEHLIQNKQQKQSPVNLYANQVVIQ